MTEQSEQLRRGTFVEHEAVYAAVGASGAPDVMRFPPEGSTPFEREFRLGSGAERFLSALNVLMTWGAQRASGIEVTDVQQGEAAHYSGIQFDESGVPEVLPDADVRYGPDGDPFITAGTTALFTWPSSEVTRKMRVVFVVDEPRNAGFALGTADAHGVVGETVFLVEHREDDSVWAVTRGFLWANDAGLFNLKARTAIRNAANDAERLLEALAPGAAVQSDAAVGASTSSGDERPDDYTEASAEGAGGSQAGVERGTEQ